MRHSFKTHSFKTLSQRIALLKKSRKPSPAMRLARICEQLERRELLDANNFIQGTVFNDTNANGAFDTSESGLPHADDQAVHVHEPEPLTLIRDGNQGNVLYLRRYFCDRYRAEHNVCRLQCLRSVMVKPLFWVNSALQWLSTVTTARAA